MAFKMGTFLLNYFGWSAYAYIAFINLDTWKGWILTLIAVAYGVLRVYFYYVRQSQEAREREFKLKHLQRQDEKEEKKQ